MKFNYLYDELMSTMMTLNLIVLFILSFDEILLDKVAGLIFWIMLIIVPLVMRFRYKHQTRAMWSSLVLVNISLTVFGAIFMVDVYDAYYSASSVFFSVGSIIMSIITYKELFKRSFRAEYGVYL